MESSLQKIPYPKRLPILKNLLSIDLKNPIMSIAGLAENYHPIFELAYPNGENVIFITGHELCKELCDEARFTKSINFVMESLQQVIGNGLFTAPTDDINWQKAHRILLPGFGHKAMKSFHDYMLQAANELVVKWETIPEETFFNISDDMARLTFETIGLCGFSYRFDSFSSKEQHPFIEAMLSSLGYIMKTFALPDFIKKLNYKAQKKFNTNIEFMYKIVDDIIKERKENPENYTDCYDFLSLMLNSVDEETGEKMTDENIRYQIITFLTAGHETTSGLLSFAFYYIIKDQNIAQKAYREVDEILGTDLNTSPSYQDINKLKYIKKILNECLRLYPTAASFGVCPKEDTVIGGKYFIKKDQPIQVMMPSLHTEKEVWGSDSKTFNPDNFDKENVKNRDPYAYKPWGNGLRTCIGQHFAMQEATLAIALILQRFKLSISDNYELKIKETLTLRPKDLMVKISTRKSEDRFLNTENDPHLSNNSINKDSDKCPFHN